MWRTYYEVFTYLAPIKPYLFLLTGAWFAHRLVGVFERHNNARAELAELRARIAQLEEEADSTQRDVLRLQAAQDFATQLLSARINDTR